jgi:hypothetical protein
MIKFKIPKEFEITKETRLLGSALVISKLDESRVAEIKKKLRKGVSITLLQKEYNISGGALRSIRAGITWKHVAAND